MYLGNLHGQTHSEGSEPSRCLLGESGNIVIAMIRNSQKT